MLVMKNPKMKVNNSFQNHIKKNKIVIHLAKECKNMYTENYNAFLSEIKDNLSK